MLRRALPLLALALVLASGVIVYAAISENQGVGYGAQLSLTGPDGVCRKVTNNSSTGAQLYVPGASTAEWQSFITNPPAGVTLSSCVCPASQYTWSAKNAAGTHSWSGIGISNDGSVIGAVTFCDVAYSSNCRGGDYIHISRDGGVSWTQTNNINALGGQWIDISLSANGTIMLVGGSNAGVYLSKDTGLTWVLQESIGSKFRWWVDVSANGTYMVAAASGEAYGGSNADYVYTSHDAGATWIRRDGAGYRSWHGVSISDNGATIYAYSPDGIFVSRDSGNTWSLLSTFPTTITSLGYGMNASGDGVHIVALTGSYTTPYRLFVSHDSGATWTGPIAPVSEEFTISRVKISDDGMRVGVVLQNWSSGGGVALSTDGGVTWARHYNPPLVSLWGVQGGLGLSRNGSYLIVGGGMNGGTLYGGQCSS